jgi:DNA invertase Pin-like site-specific DNA recombinase
VCWDLDRLTRQPRQLEDWIEAATDRGLMLVTANGEADLSTDGGRMFARIKASVARAEIERKSARQKRAALQRAERGRPPLGTRLTGYTVQGDVIEHEASVVRKIFERFAAGDSLRSLAAWLTASEVATRRSGRTWNPSTVSTMLQNPRYAGRAIYDGKETGKPGVWTPIVAEDVFTLVQARLADPRRKTNRQGTDRRHLGSGLFECGPCGRRLVSWSGGRYRCPSACVTRSRSHVEDFVLRVIRERLTRPDLADLVVPAGSGEARALNDEIARLRAQLVQIDEDYDAGHITGQRCHSHREGARRTRGQAGRARSAQQRHRRRSNAARARPRRGVRRGAADAATRRCRDAVRRAVGPLSPGPPCLRPAKCPDRLEDRRMRRK